MSKRYDRKRVCFAHNVKEETHVKRTKTPSVLYSEPWRGLAGQGCDRARFVIKWGGKGLPNLGNNELEEGRETINLVKFIEHLRIWWLSSCCGSNLVSRDFWWGRYRRCHYPSCGYHQRCLWCLSRRKSCLLKPQIHVQSSCPFFVMDMAEIDSKELVPGDIVALKQVTWYQRTYVW